jgi:hypothetical protein
MTQSHRNSKGRAELRHLILLFCGLVPSSCVSGQQERCRRPLAGERLRNAGPVTGGEPRLVRFLHTQRGPDRHLTRTCTFRLHGGSGLSRLHEAKRPCRHLLFGKGLLAHALLPVRSKQAAEQKPVRIRKRSTS